MIDVDEWINRLFVLCNILGDIYRLFTELYLVFEFELGPGSRGQARPGGGTGHSV